MKKRIAVFLYAFVLMVGAVSLAAGEDSGRTVLVAEVEGVINPVSSEFLLKALKRAEETRAEALVVRLDTPGGLSTSMREMIKAIVGSEVPVVTYVSPSGARAASAGLFITVASHVAAMAPGTNIGAAHPVAMGGEEMDEVMKAKVENDSAAYIRSLAEKRGRNAEWSEKAVRESVSISETEALKLGVIDLVSDDLKTLLDDIDGMTVSTAFGDRKLATKGAGVVDFEMGWRLEFLKILSNPEVAYILMMLGMLGIYLELSNPGLIVPGVVGAMALLLAFYSFNTLPVNYAGIGLIILGLLLFLLEIKVTSFGMLSVAGVICLILGSIMLIDSPLPYMRISLWIILPVAGGTGLFAAILVRMAIRSHRSKVSTGAEGIVGEAGVALSDISPEGSAFVQGTYWNVYSDTPIKKGEKVVVQSMDGLKLKVEPK